MLRIYLCFLSFCVYMCVRERGREGEIVCVCVCILEGEQKEGGRSDRD